VSDRRRLVGVLVTYRRPAALAITLERLAEQDRRLDRLVVVDNAPSPDSRAAVGGATQVAGAVDHLEMPENLGFTGGVAAGMRHVLEFADDRDWIVVLDDDDPVPYSTVFSELEQFAERMLERDPRTAGVAITGGRFDWRRGRIRRVRDDELHEAVRVDHVAGNQVPFYLVAAVRDAGTFHAPLFFGLSEIEFGLRVSRAGYHFYAHGDLWRQRREAAGRLGLDATPSRTLGPMNWRRYYVLRNSIYMLRRFGHTWTAVRVSTVNLGKPILNLPRRPRLAAVHLKVNLRACRDGWTGRMGKQLEPDSDARHSGKAGAAPGSASPRGRPTERSTDATV
jgi:rhamnopyranosyl-N-acetylglucosaminyl-diphospho-decaprenol beta-1,3/1,4-galactofuranosyltransferase